MRPENTGKPSCATSSGPGCDVGSIMLIAFLGLFLSGYNNFMVAIALIEIKPKLHLGPVAVGLILAATFLGMLIGGSTLGRLADVMGRRPVMILNMLMITVFAIFSGLVGNAGELFVMRLLMGIGIGAGYPIGSTYVADLSPSRDRGARMTLAFCGWGFGALASGLVGWAMLSVVPPNMGWRLMLASGAIPAIVALVVIRTRCLPESHCWKSSQSLEPLPFKTLLSRSYRSTTMAALLPWFLMDLPVYGIGLLIPTVLLQLHIGGADAVVLTTCGLSIFTLLGFAVAYHTIDRIGRRQLQIIGFIGMAVLFTILAVAGAGINKFELLALFAAIQIFINAGPNTTTWIVAAEVFPTRLRASGQGSATAFSRIGAASGAFFLPVIDAKAGLGAAFAVVAVASILAAVITAIYLPETARCDLNH
ncbi:MAG: MFS transporter [Phycisphaerae bacterium]